MVEARSRDGRAGRRPIRSLVLLLTMFAATSCGPGAPDPAQPGPSDRPTEFSEDFVLYFVRSGASDAYVEAAEWRRDVIPDDLTAAVRTAVELLLLAAVEPGEPVSALLPDLTSFAPPGVSVLGVVIEDDIVVIDLSGEVRSPSGSSLQERVFAQQLAHTALLDRSLTSVRLLVDGAPISELWGHLDWSVPLRADPAALSPIVIEEPGPATTRVGDPRITVAGQASVPGGKVLLRLEDEAGRVAAEASVTATEAAPGRGAWTWDVRLPDPGTWIIVARAAEPSDGPGAVPFETRRATSYER